MQKPALGLHDHQFTHTSTDRRTNPYTRYIIRRGAIYVIWSVEEEPEFGLPRASEDGGYGAYWEAIARYLTPQCWRRERDLINISEIVRNNSQGDTPLSIDCTRGIQPTNPVHLRRFANFGWVSNPVAETRISCSVFPPGNYRRESY